MACPTGSNSIGECDNTYSCSDGCQGWQNYYMHSYKRCQYPGGHTECSWYASTWIDCCG
ncbi:hypothetical protein [Paenibacillus oryzae]|uniref:hypothetical protein n=1 Tax=Paenibacillus oryzae TaxID=1844972 RepID=UPI0012EA862C|nr:hypothetical protein [Paenibacillus oryzae]